MSGSNSQYHSEYKIQSSHLDPKTGLLLTAKEIQTVHDYLILEPQNGLHHIKDVKFPVWIEDNSFYAVYQKPGEVKDDYHLAEGMQAVIYYAQRVGNKNQSPNGVGELSIVKQFAGEPEVTGGPEEKADWFKQQRDHAERQKQIRALEAKKEAKVVNHIRGAGTASPVFVFEKRTSSIDSSGDLTKFKQDVYAIRLPLEKGINLQDYLEEIKIGEKDPLTRNEIIQIMRQVLDEVNLLLARGLLHLDLKAGNIMVYRNSQGDFEAKLIDFGTSLEVKSLDEKATTQSSQLIGTRKYLAPELEAQEKKAVETKAERSKPFVYSQATEIFSLGSLLGNMLSASKDENKDLAALQRAMQDDDVRNRPATFDKCIDQFRLLPQKEQRSQVEMKSKPMEAAFKKVESLKDQYTGKMGKHKKELQGLLKNANKIKDDKEGDKVARLFILVERELQAEKKDWAEKQKKRQLSKNPFKMFTGSKKKYSDTSDGFLQYLQHEKGHSYKRSLVEVYDYLLKNYANEISRLPSSVERISMRESLKHAKTGAPMAEEKLEIKKEEKMTVGLKRLDGK